MLDCGLNDPNVPVQIYRKRASYSEQSFEIVDPQTDPFVTQIGQNNFSITLPDIEGNIDYRCVEATEQGGQPVLEKTVTLGEALGLLKQSCEGCCP